MNFPTVRSLSSPSNNFDERGSEGTSVSSPFAEFRLEWGFFRAAPSPSWLTMKFFDSDGPAPSRTVTDDTARRHRAQSADFISCSLRERERRRLFKSRFRVRGRQILMPPDTFYPFILSINIIAASRGSADRSVLAYSIRMLRDARVLTRAGGASSRRFRFSQIFPTALRRKPQEHEGRGYVALYRH